MIPSVLIVDDVADVRASIAELLEASGEFSVAGEAADGSEAVTIARETSPDLIVMDIRMPGMDGIEATRAIVSASPEAVVVAHSAYQDVSLVRDMIGAGARGYILKGGGGERLLDALRSAQLGHAVLQPEIARALLDDLRQLYDAQVEHAKALEGKANLYQEAATRDHLTGLRNHRAFHEEAEELIAAAESRSGTVAVAILDIDDFKLVNDLRGHASGDRLLEDLGRSLTEAIGDAGRLYRIGGDELAVIFIDTTKAAASDLMERARTTIRDMQFGPHPRQTISVGIAAYPDDGADKDHVLAVADSAMYEAKSRGKDTVVVAGDDVPIQTLDRLNASDEAVRRTVIAVTAAVGAKDEDLLRHCEAVSTLAALIAEQLGMSPAEAETVRLGGLLHDVGKIGVPDRVLLKSGLLDPAELSRIHTHPAIGRTILGRTLPRPIVDCVAHHHEQPDGNGYPARLSGEQIPFTAGIVRVADVFDSLTRVQPWRPARTPDEALGELHNGAGTLFDARAVEALSQMLTMQPVWRAA
ncbi:MAG: diguanylate cyclase [Dehalococcoidia bacterium]